LQRSPDLLAGFKGPTTKEGRGSVGMGAGKGRGEKGGEGTGIEGGKWRGPPRVS